MKDERQEKFEKLAEKRVNDAIKKIISIGNLSNRSNYVYSERHVKQMFSAIKSAVKEAETRFTNSDQKDESYFKFDVSE